MQTKFEHFAASAMIGAEDAPPRRNGNLHFERPWEARIFGVALALAKTGHFEWEDFRESLIETIGEWENLHPDTSEGWDYYENWLRALERKALDHGLVGGDELAEKAEALASQSGDERS